MYGSDYAYAESRLADSIVRIAKTGEPVMVQAISPESGLAAVYQLSDRKTGKVPLDALNLKPVPLGWCNLPDGATYLARIPKRRDWRQGIRAETCFSSKVQFRRIPYENIARCIRGEYPKLSELVKQPWDKLQAWSRKWASDGHDVYFGHLGNVGRLVNGKPVLNDGFLFLKENLESSLS